MNNNNYKKANICPDEFPFVGGISFCKVPICPSQSQVYARNLPDTPLCAKAMGIAPENTKNLEAVLN